MPTVLWQLNKVDRYICDIDSQRILCAMTLTQESDHIVICEWPLEWLFCRNLYHSIMIHPYDTVLPIGMGLVEIPVELAKAIYLLPNHKHRKECCILWAILMYPFGKNTRWRLKKRQNTFVLERKNCVNWLMKTLILVGSLWMAIAFK